MLVVRLFILLGSLIPLPTEVDRGVVQFSCKQGQSYCSDMALFCTGNLTLIVKPVAGIVGDADERQQLPDDDSRRDAQGHPQRQILLEKAHFTE